MKKWILFILIFILVVAGVFYFIIPKNVHLQQGISIAVNAKGFSRTIMNEKNWLAWWPGEIITNTGKGYGSFRFNDTSITLLKKDIALL